MEKFSAQLVRLLFIINVKVYYRVDESKEAKTASSVGDSNKTLAVENVDEEDMVKKLASPEDIGERNKTLAVESVDKEDNIEELASVEDDNVGPAMLLGELELDEPRLISSDD